MEASVFAGAFVVVIGGAFLYFTVTIVIYRGALCGWLAFGVADEKSLRLFLRNVW
jgi:hypothetical protein